MEFKKISEIEQNEIYTLLKIIYPTAQVISFKHHRETNFISVTYSFLNEVGKEHKLDLLPDDVYIIEDGDDSEGHLLADGDTMYRYRQFTIARGYSEMWLNNLYVEI